MWNGLSRCFSDKIFDLALCLSLLVHLVLFCNIPKLRVRPGEAPRLIYRRTLSPPPQPPPPQYVSRKQASPKAKMEMRKEMWREGKRGKRLLPKQKPDQGVSPMVVEKMKKIDFLSPEEIDDELFKKMIEVQKVPADPRVKAYYLKYYDDIRHKIRDTAFLLYRRGMRGGDVFISFILDSTGRLVEAHVVPEKSSAPRSLFVVAMNALYKASPFGPFPPELVQDQLRFNVIISFHKR